MPNQVWLSVIIHQTQRMGEVGLPVTGLPTVCIAIRASFQISEIRDDRVEDPPRRICRGLGRRVFLLTMSGSAIPKADISPLKE